MGAGMTFVMHFDDTRHPCALHDICASLPLATMSPKRHLELTAAMLKNTNVSKNAMPHPSKGNMQGISHVIMLSNGTPCGLSPMHTSNTPRASQEGRFPPI